MKEDPILVSEDIQFTKFLGHKHNGAHKSDGQSFHKTSADKKDPSLYVNFFATYRTLLNKPCKDDILKLTSYNSMKNINKLWLKLDEYIGPHQLHIYDLICIG